MLISSKITKAIEFCCELHKGQTRKASVTPYASHPISVGFILHSAGYNEEVVIAGILHDILEDTIGTEEDITDLFGERVTFLVKGVTEDTSIKNWEQKKAKYLEHLKTAGNDVRAVSAADLLDNNRAMLRALKNKINIWEAFSVTSQEKLTYIKNRLGIIKETINNEITKEIEISITQLENSITS